MTLRRFAIHNFDVVALEYPVAGDSVYSVLTDAQELLKLAHENAMVLLSERVPADGPPFDEGGVAWAKKLHSGLSEFVILNRIGRRRQDAKLSSEEKRVGIRIFFFEYDLQVICTNACFKTSPTPKGALSAAFANMDAFLKSKNATTWKH